MLAGKFASTAVGGTIYPVRAALFRWFITGVLLPLAPFALSVLFRMFADETSPASQPILWNSELPFFTLVTGLSAGEKYFQIKDIVSEKVREVLFFAFVLSATMAGLSLLFLAPYYMDQHVQRVLPKMRSSVELFQLTLACVQLLIGVGMLYADVTQRQHRGS